jgi:hypothetical protein
MNGLPLLKESVSLGTRSGFFLQQGGASPQSGLQVAAYLNQAYENHWIGRGGPAISTAEISKPNPA